ncbi:hypothetical protein BHM03_00049579 [Ensete ventricosum]|nr:hypothetical protein BHM03_00049579 [Ensete ventricosum]
MKMGRGLATTSSMPVGITDYAIISLLRTLLCALKRKVAWGEGCWRHRSSKGVDDGSGSNARAAGDEEKERKKGKGCCCCVHCWKECSVIALFMSRNRGRVTNDYDIAE